MNNIRANAVSGYCGFKPEHKFYVPEPKPMRNIEGTRCHMPGYKGYVPAVKSENALGQSFARISSHALNGRIAKGENMSVSERYCSTNQATFVDQKNLHNEAKDLNPFLKPRCERISPLSVAGRNVMGSQNSPKNLVPYSEIHKQVYGK